MTQALAAADREVLAIARTARNAGDCELTTHEGWDDYAHHDVACPALGPCPPPGAKVQVAPDDPRLAYHAMLPPVPLPDWDAALLDSVRTFRVNASRRQSQMHMVIDGPPGTGGTALLRAIGRNHQRQVEKLYRDRIPVVYIVVPHEGDSKLSWIWEIADYLALVPEPKSATDKLPLRYPDLTNPVTHVLRRAKTSMILIDGIARVTPADLATVLPYLEYLRDKLNIAVVFCGTGAQHIVEAAFHRATGTRPDPDVTSTRPVITLSPLPYTTTGTYSFGNILASFEKNLCLHRLTPKALVNHAKYLHRRTDGHIKTLSHLICTAAQEAIMTGAEDITKDLLDSIRVGRHDTR